MNIFPPMMHPWFAVAGIAAVGIAVWMHLYERTAAKRIKVSSLRLVPPTPVVARSRRRIRHWLLFLLRALGVLLLGLAFARPGGISGGSGGSVGPETVAFVLDRTGSMNMKESAGESSWDQAVEHLRARLGDMDPGSRVRLYCFPPAETGSEWTSPSALRSIVAGLRPSSGAGRPADVLEAASAALAAFRSDMPESLEIVGDLQAAGWEEIDTISLPEELRVTVHQVGDPEAPNRGLSVLSRGRDQNRRAAIITLGGSSPLSITDTPSGETREILLPEEVTELPNISPASGWIRREVVLSENSDGLAADDRAFDTFFSALPVPVYLLEPEPGIETFRQRTFFLKQALQPSEGAGFGDTGFEPRTLPLADAITTLSEVEETDVVIVIPALAEWPAGLPDAVRKIVARGGAAVFFAGPEMDAAAYAAAWKGLVPPLSDEISPLNRRLSLPPADASHPIWGGLGDKLRREIRRAPLKYRLQLPDNSPSGVLASYADGIPFVSEVSSGKGKSIFVNGSIDRSWGDLQADGSLYVPMMHMLMYSAADPVPRDLRNGPGAGIVGEPFSVQVDSGLAGTTVMADGKEITVDPQGWIRGLGFPKPGHYDITSADGVVIRPVAVNFPPDESRREMIQPTILRRQIEARRRTAEAGGSAPRISLLADSGWWRWILVLLAAVWLFEPWLALRSSKPSTPSKAS